MSEDWLMRARWYIVGLLALPVVAVVALALAFNDTDGCRGVSWWTTWLWIGPIPVPPYTVLVTAAIAAWGYCLAKATSPRRGYALAAAVSFAIVGGIGTWFLAIADAFDACPP